MKKNTLVVLEQGNDCAFNGPMTACCVMAFDGLF